MEWKMCEGRRGEQGRGVGDLSGSFTILVTVL